MSVALQPDDSRLMLAMFAGMAADDLRYWDVHGGMPQTAVYRISNDPEEDEAVDRLEKAGLVATFANEGVDNDKFPRLATFTPAGYLATMYWSFSRATKNTAYQMSNESVAEEWGKLLEDVHTAMSGRQLPPDLLMMFMLNAAVVGGLETKAPNV